MNRFIIYAMGQIFYENQDLINWGEIVAIADKNGDNTSMYHDVPIIRPDQIAKHEFNYIAVFSNVYFEEIKSQLMGCYFIPEQRIVSWRFLFSYNICNEKKILDFYIELLDEFQFDRVLDVGMRYFPKYFFAIEKIRKAHCFSMDGIGVNKHIIGNSLYKNVYRDIEKCTDNYDIAIFWDNSEEILDKIKKLEGKTRYILFHVPFCREKGDIIEKIDISMCNRFKHKRLATAYAVFWLVDLSPQAILKDIHIYVATHKAYQVQNNDLYQPICVGSTYRNTNFFMDSTGDNISHLNEKINECTALYWLWKNTNTRYVGLNHYRRYFYNNGIYNSSNYLDKENVCRLLEKYDIVLASSVVRYNGTVLDGILENIDHDLCMEAIRIVTKAMSRHQPDYLDAFDEIMNGYVFHPCNMFVTKRKVLNDYCEWLFSFLIEAAENMDVSGHGPYDKRIIGFLAERMLTIWLIKQNLKIKELPYTSHFGLD